jgi:DNA-binding NarL/FixJ family response regulator
MTKMRRHSIDVHILSMHPALVGVVRLAAAAVPGIDRIAVIDVGRPCWTNVTADVSIVVVDLADDDTRQELRSIATTAPSVRIVVLGDRVDPACALDLVRSDAYGFVRTPDDLDELPIVLERVARGERSLPPDMERLAVFELGRSVKRARSVSGLAPSITDREHAVLELLAEGFTARQIGRRLGISPRTVETHVAKLYRKLTVRTRLQAITRGSSLGLIELR